MVRPSCSTEKAFEELLDFIYKRDAKMKKDVVESGIA